MQINYDQEGRRPSRRFFSEGPMRVVPEAGLGCKGRYLRLIDEPVVDRAKRKFEPVENAKLVENG
jgi:hypothetical protein